MSVGTWDYPNPFSLVDPLGTLLLNQAITFPVTGESGYYLINHEGSSIRAPLRVTNTNLPQKDGSQLHHRFYEGFEMTLAIQLWQTLDDIACDELLQEMVDVLRKHLRQFTHPPVPPSDARIYWTPDGFPQRMLKAAKLNETVEQTQGTAEPVTITATFKSPYPYAMDAAEITDTLNDTLVNGGSADFWPVVKVFGPTSGFTITNTDVEDDDGNDLKVVYDASQVGASSIGGGDFVEIDMFWETMYLNGSGANMKPGLVMSQSTFFPLQVGSNALTTSGPTTQVLWQDAWG